jgi:2-methylisocitrate lyase-like PEP mutase family enzyme
MTGADAAATLGHPDYGLVTMSEVGDNAGRIASAVACRCRAHEGVWKL